MSNIKFTSLTIVLFALSPLQAVLAETDPGAQAPAPAGAEITTLPPVGKGQDMVKPYQQQEAVARPVIQNQPRAVPRDRVNTPYSREVVLPSHRYGSPGYEIDGRGGRGYDFGYPGYRPQGGGGYPHHRQFGAPRLR